MAVAFQPSDRTKREHLARVERAVWCDPDAPAVILRLADGASAIGPATADQFTSGSQYRFYGSWVEGQRGPDFRFSTFTIDQPFSREAVQAYLSKVCSNVGNRIASKLYDAYGAEAVKTLREQPATITAAGIMSEAAAAEAAADLARFSHMEATKVELFGLFAGRGFPAKAIDAAISKWGVAAPATIAKDPFALLVNKLPGAGFKRCDKFYLELRKPADSIKRQFFCAWSVIREDRTGSTWCDAREIVQDVLKVIPAADPVRALRLLDRTGWARIRRDGAARYVTTRERATAEQRVADAVRRLQARTPPNWPASIPASETEGDGLPSQHQVAELLKATAGPVGCFTGGPGTGKTHTLAYLLKATIAKHGAGSVAVAAPTGKAAVRARESLQARGIELRATTIHRLLEIGRAGHDGGGWGFQRNRKRPLNERFLIIDESSMIDAELCADLMDAVADGANVLFVGDPFQLPPVGHGAPLRDLLAAGQPQGELTEVRRNSGAIVRGCAAIKRAEPVQWSERIDLDAEDPANLRLIDCTAAETVDTLAEVLENLTRFDPRWDTQIITALNDKSESSRTKLNERFGKILNPDGREVKGNKFRTGDKIICHKNTDLKIVQLSNRCIEGERTLDAANYRDVPGPAAYIANGEIGRVLAVSDKHTIARFGAGDDAPMVKIANSKRKAAPVDDAGNQNDDDATKSAVEFDLAWAITVHRSQGSEWPLVIVLIDPAAGAVADRNFWYTALSRARQCAIAVGPRGTFEAQVKRQALDGRRTFLAELIREPMPLPPATVPTTTNAAPGWKHNTKQDLANYAAAHRM